MDFSIIHIPEKNRFEFFLEGQTAYIEYETFKDGFDLAHTYVPKELEGRGIAAALVKQALRYARDHHWQVKASCPYVAHYLQKHPEEAPAIRYPF